MKYAISLTLLILAGIYSLSLAHQKTKIQSELKVEKAKNDSLQNKLKIEQAKNAKSDSLQNLLIGT